MARNFFCLSRGVPFLNLWSSWWLLLCNAPLFLYLLLRLVHMMLKINILASWISLQWQTDLWRKKNFFLTDIWLDGLTHLMLWGKLCIAYCKAIVPTSWWCCSTVSVAGHAVTIRSIPQLLERRPWTRAKPEHDRHRSILSAGAGCKELCVRRRGRAEPLAGVQLCLWLVTWSLSSSLHIWKIKELARDSF